MRFDLKRAIIAGTVCIFLSGCGVIGGKNRPAPAADYPDQGRNQAGVPQIAMPDGDGQAAGSASAPQYDDVGYAGWYGDELRGSPTALGEPFNPSAMSAAHPNLPLPSFAEVTHLGTGKTIIVRINDRGPAAGGRIIDLSQTAALALGGGQQGAFPVRVRRVNPPEDERAALESGAKGANRLDTPEPLLIALRKKLGNGAPPVVARPNTAPPAQPSRNQTVSRPTGTARPGANYEQPSDRPRPPEPQAGEGDQYIVEDGNQPRQTSVPSGQAGGYYVQVAAFSTRQRAEAAARSVGGSIQQVGSVWRVRTGPYPSDAAARAALGSVAAKGFRDARVTR
jgi:rare lipoprotein A